MNTSPAIFSFNDLSVRAFADDRGEPWFCAADVCSVLGYRNAPDAVAKHCRAAGIAKRDTGVVTGKTAAGHDAKQQVEMTFINEGNLYRLIVKSRKPEAEKFEQLVMDEILPAIRKTGQYTAPRTSTVIDRKPLDAALKKLVSVLGKRGKAINFNDAWSLVHVRMGISSVEELTTEQVPQALAVIGSILEGELLGRLELPAPAPAHALPLAESDCRNLQCMHKHSRYAEQEILLLRSTLEGLKSPLIDPLIGNLRERIGTIRRYMDGIVVHAGLMAL